MVRIGGSNRAKNSRLQSVAWRVCADRRTKLESLFRNACRSQRPARRNSAQPRPIGHCRRQGRAFVGGRAIGRQTQNERRGIFAWARNETVAASLCGARAEGSLRLTQGVAHSAAATAVTILLSKTGLFA